jgi:hypothetical protein
MLFYIQTDSSIWGYVGYMEQNLASLRLHCVCVCDERTQHVCFAVLAGTLPKVPVAEDSIVLAIGVLHVSMVFHSRC